MLLYQVRTHGVPPTVYNPLILACTERAAMLGKPSGSGSRPSNWYGSWFGRGFKGWDHWHEVGPKSLRSVRLPSASKYERCKAAVVEHVDII